MSLIHRLAVGHFDPGTFRASRPVPLRPLDEARTRAMLEGAGVRVGEGAYLVGVDRLIYAGGYCDCEWHSAGFKEGLGSEQLLRGIAEAEDCFLVELGVGEILHPDRVAWDAARGDLAPRSVPLAREEAEAIARGDDPEALRRVVLEAARAVGEEGWVAGFCAEMAGHGDLRVRGNAFYGLARLAERRAALDRGRIQPIIEAGMADPEVYVSGHAEAVEDKLRWVIAAFDNGNPEMEVAAHANGWV